jgi:lipopolysaccharide heptosyltransferase II
MTEISVNRILLSRMKFIGDVVLTTPIIRAVREKYQGAYIAYCGERHAVSLLENNPCLDEIIPFDFSVPAVVEQPRVMWKLRQRRFDVFVDLFCNPRTALLAAASGAPVRIGKEVKGRGLLYTHRITDDGLPKTAIDFHYQYVKPLGVEATHRKTEIFLTEEEKRRAGDYLLTSGIDPEKPVVGIYPGATWPAKAWPAECFSELAALLTKELDLQLVVTQGPSDAELVQQIARSSGGRVTVLGVLPLRQLAAVLSHIKVYVSNDCGPMHIAVAVGTPTIGIFGPGEENIWFPYDQAAGHLALRKDVPCHPCHLDFCNRQGEEYMECMKLLGPAEVFEAVQARLPRP